MSPIVSVIVPVYNSELYIERCINSILNQTFTDFELLLVDDGSTDKSGVICEAYASIDKRVIVYHQSNQGQAAARNFAIKKSRGEWIHFVDSDDVIYPEMLMYLYMAVTQFDANMAVCNYLESEQITEGFFKKHSYESYFVEIEEETLKLWFREGSYYWLAWAKLIKKSIIERNMFSAGKFYEDNAVVIKWIYDSERVAVIPLALYFYQVNYSGTTKGKIDYRYFDFLWAMEQQIDFFDSINYFSLLEEILLYYFASFEDRYSKTALVHKGRKIRFSIKLQAVRMWFKYAKRYKTVRCLWKNYMLLTRPKISIFIHKMKRRRREK